MSNARMLPVLQRPWACVRKSRKWDDFKRIALREDFRTRDPTDLGEARPTVPSSRCREGRI